MRADADARRLLQDRIYALHELRHHVVAHFDEMQAQIEKRILPLLDSAPCDPESAEIAPLLEEFASTARTTIARMKVLSQSFVPVCTALAASEFGDREDELAAAHRSDPACGLLWCLTPGALDLWTDLWSPDIWSDRWAGKDAGQSQRETMQFFTTVRSIVTQKVDDRLRAAQQLQRRIAAGGDA